MFFFRQKTGYEMRISDGSSDVCSSYLVVGDAVGGKPEPLALLEDRGQPFGDLRQLAANGFCVALPQLFGRDVDDAACVDDIVGGIVNALGKQPFTVCGGRKLVVCGDRPPRSAERRVGREWVSSC